MIQMIVDATLSLAGYGCRLQDSAGATVSNMLVRRARNIVMHYDRVSSLRIADCWELLRLYEMLEELDGIHGRLHDIDPKNSSMNSIACCVALLSSEKQRLAQYADVPKCDIDLPRIVRSVNWQLRAYANHCGGRMRLGVRFELVERIMNNLLDADERLGGLSSNTSVEATRACVRRQLETLRYERREVKHAQSNFNSESRANVILMEARRVQQRFRQDYECRDRAVVDLGGLFDICDQMQELETQLLSVCLASGAAREYESLTRLQAVVGSLETEFMRVRNAQRK